MATTVEKIGSTWFKIGQAKILNRIFGQVAGAVSAAFTIGAEDTNVINVAVALKDAAGVALEELQGVKIFLSDAATGIGLAATAPDGGWAIGTDGAVLDAIVAGKASWVQTEADGTFDLDITETGALTVYAVVELPNGQQIVSSAITFAA